MMRWFSNGPYQREFIRANMNQNFEKMAVEATLAWPMIMHLDNKDNVGPNSISAKQEWLEKRKKTCNYKREPCKRTYGTSYNITKGRLYTERCC